jgi:hypothetical protein
VWCLRTDVDAESSNSLRQRCVGTVHATVALEGFRAELRRQRRRHDGISIAPRSPKLDVAVRYQRGGEAVYLTEGPIRRAGERVVLDFSRSHMDMVFAYIGVAFGR